MASQAITYALDRAQALQGRKFDDGDVMGDAVLRQAALEYVKNYDGSFEFVVKLQEQRKPLSIGQLRGLLNCLRSDRTLVKPEVVAVPDTLEAIGTLFATASAKLKHPRITLVTEDKQTVRLTIAGKTARFPGSVNVTDGGSYGNSRFFGRVLLTGEFESKPYTPASVLALLKVLATDPVGTAAAYGKMTGFCCFCTAQLTDDRSVTVGYGPVCAKNYGLSWGKAA